MGQRPRLKPQEVVRPSFFNIVIMRTESQEPFTENLSTISVSQLDLWQIINETKHTFFTTVSIEQIIVHSSNPVPQSVSNSIPCAMYDREW